MEPALHNYFFSVETVLVLFFYKTDGVTVLLISLLEHLPRKGRHEFNAFLTDTHNSFFASAGRASSSIGHRFHIVEEQTLWPSLSL